MNFYPPMNIALRNPHVKFVFLAGSIEMGMAEDWQRLSEIFFNKHGWGTFNPRRPDWDNSWKQSFDEPQFFQQVTWELQGLEVSDLIILNLIPNTKSPISLLELGRFSNSGKLHVVCPEGFWRKGNVDIFCNRYEVPLYPSFTAFEEYFSKHIAISA